MPYKFNAFTGNFDYYESSTGGMIPSEDMSYGVASGTNTYTVTLSPAITEYTTGLLIPVKFTNANTSTTPTINCNSLGAKTIVSRDGTALSVGQIVANGLYYLTYDGTNFVLSTGYGIYTLTFFHTSNQSLADNTSYFVGQNTAPATNASLGSGVANIAGTVVGWACEVFNASTVGSSEAGTLKLWYNNGANSITLSTAITYDANRNAAFSGTGLSTAINAGYCYIEYMVPSMTTNPNGARVAVNIYIRPW